MRKTFNFHNVDHDVEHLISIHKQGVPVQHKRSVSGLIKIDDKTIVSDKVEDPVVVKDGEGLYMLIKPEGFVDTPLYRAVLLSKHILKKARTDILYPPAPRVVENRPYENNPNYRNNGFNKLQNHNDRPGYVPRDFNTYSGGYGRVDSRNDNNGQGR